MAGLAQALPTYADIVSAQERIAPYAVETPLIESAALNELTGGRVLLKAEPLQRMGVFKFRGAYNVISRLSHDEWPGGVVACSSGNHAQGVGEAARLCGFDAVIVMPRDAPALKIARTRATGAEVVLYDRASEDRSAIAERISDERKAAFVPPYDDAQLIAGQGTLGREMVEQATKLGADFDAVLVPVGGGGLVSGVALAFEELSGGTEVHPVEPAGFDDLARSMKAGEIVSNERLSGSVCDALLAHQPGRMTFEFARRLFAPAFAVSDAEACAAVAYAFYNLKLVVEPGGAVPLAALLSGRVNTDGRTIGIVLSGGNVDGETFSQIISADHSAVFSQ